MIQEVTVTDWEAVSHPDRWASPTSSSSVGDREVEEERDGDNEEVGCPCLVRWMAEIWVVTEPTKDPAVFEATSVRE